jgi:hypothetical protein
VAHERLADGERRRVRWSIAIPQLVEDGKFDPSGLRAYLDRAEGLGFESG